MNIQRLLNIQFARNDMEENITLPSHEEMTEKVISSASITIEELEQYAELFKLDTRTVLEIEHTSRTSIEQASILLLHHIARKTNSKPKKQLARKLSRVTGESMSTAIAEQVIEVCKYAGFGAIARFVDFSHFVPFLNEHSTESVITLSIVIFVTFVSSHFAGKGEE